MDSETVDLIYLAKEPDQNKVPLKIVFNDWRENVAE